jgi:POT family proton-dependent oligopeptide transporter
MFYFGVSDYLEELSVTKVYVLYLTKLSPKDYLGMMGMWFWQVLADGTLLLGLGAGMSSPDEEALLVTKLQGYTEGYINWQYML